MLGALPLAIGFGEGAELRRPLGISIVGGLLVSQVLTLVHDPGDLSLSRPAAAVGPAATEPAPSAATASPSPANDQNPSSRRRPGSIAVKVAALARLGWRQRKFGNTLLVEKWIPAFAGMTIGLAVSACTVGPDYQRPSATVPAAYKEAAQQGPNGRRRSRPMRSIAARGGRSTAIRCSMGWSGRSTISNQNLKASEAAFRQAEAIVAQARAGFFPTRPDQRLGDALAWRRQQGAAVRRVGRRSRAASPISSASPGRRAGLPICGARSAAQSRATSRPRRPAPADVANARLPARASSPATTCSCASPTS